MGAAGFPRSRAAGRIEIARIKSASGGIGGWRHGLFPDFKASQFQWLRLPHRL